MHRVLLAMAQDAALDGLRAALTSEGFVVIVAADIAAADVSFDDSIDAVVMDLATPTIDGVALLERLSLRNPAAVRVVATDAADVADHQRAIAALNLGARYLLTKPFPPRLLIERLQALFAERDRVIDLGAMVARRLAPYALSERDRRLVTYVLKGMSNATIAGALGVGEQSVKNGLFALYQKLGISSRAELFHLVFPL